MWLFKLKRLGNLGKTQGFFSNMTEPKVQDIVCFCPRADLSVKAVAKESAWGQGVVHNFIHRRYFTQWRDEFYVGVARAISHEIVSTVFLMTAFLTIFRRFLINFWRFVKILQNLSKDHMNVASIFWKFLKITEDYQGLLRERQSCFDGTPTNISTI